MSDICISPSKLNGTVAAPSSKSVAHRALICAALAGRSSVVRGVGASRDVEATIGCLRALGFQLHVDGEDVHIRGRSAMDGSCTLDCHESGSTLRFLIPVAAALGAQARFVGRGRLPERPISEYSILEQHGIKLSFQEKSLPLELGGQLTGGTFAIRGDVSSQYITGLLLALPLLHEDSEIILTTPLESAPYVHITIDVMRLFGATVERTPSGYRVRGGTGYRSADYTVEGDYSQAAFWLSAGAISGSVTVTNLNPNSAQGDREIIHLLRRFGAKIECAGHTVTATKAPLRGIEIDATHIPDLVPILAVVAAYSEGKTVISNCGRLRLKECDRLEAVADCITRLDGRIIQGSDWLSIIGSPLRGGTIADWNDHRIPMSMAVAALGAGRDTIIQGWECISKSYPDYFMHYRALGGKAHELSLGK